MKKIVAFCCFAAVAAALCSSCSDDKMCRCYYFDGSEAYTFEAEESENCSDATTSSVICYEEKAHININM